MSTERKVAVITGASHGIGAALVTAYCEHNYRVIATARSLERSNDDDVLAVAPRRHRRPEHGGARYLPGVARFGRIDTLVNNAGIFIAKPFTEYTEADYAAILGVNLTGFFHMTQLAIAEMEKQGGGHIVQYLRRASSTMRILRALRAGVAHEGRSPAGDPVARHRGRQAPHPRERRLARHH